jgi:hypothetical protein
MKGINCNSLDFLRDDLPSYGPAEVAVKIRDKGAGAGLGDNNALLFQLAVGLGNCVGVYGKLPGQMSYRRQLFILEKLAQGNVTLDLVNYLLINGPV